MTGTSSQSGRAFTCDLSAEEFLLVTGAGWEPTALVSGDVTFTLGSQASSRRRSKELKWISDGLARGQALALEKMRAQAAEIGSHGIVGVRLTASPVNAGEYALSSILHFSALGTAICRPDTPAPKPATPFTTHLSGQDAWALLTAGHVPLGVVFGFSVYHAASDNSGLRDNEEMPFLTDAVYSARELAMTRMQAQAKKLRARGIVGVSVDTRIGAGPTVEFSVLGTAITAARRSADQPPPQTALAVNPVGQRRGPMSGT